MRKIDKALFSLADSYWKPLILLMLVVLSFLIRHSVFSIQSSALDWGAYLSPWIQQYRVLGIKGLSTTIGDYYVPYNIILAIISHFPFPDYYMVPLVSYIFELGIAYQTYIIVREQFHKSWFVAALIGVILLFLPITFLNSSYWKQCDAIFTFFTIAGIRYLITNQPNRGLIMIGLSLSFKLQAVFILPFCGFLYFKKRNIPILSFLWIPGIFLLSGLPSILLGRSVTSTYGTYISQIHANRVMSINSMNVWAFMPNALELYDAAILLSISVLLVCFAFLYSRNNYFQNGQMYIQIAAWSIITCFVFLPSMHERYDFAGLLLLYICVFCGKHFWITTILLHSVSTLSYVQYLFNLSFPNPLLAIVYISGYILFTYDLLTSSPAHETSCQINISDQSSHNYK